MNNPIQTKNTYLKLALNSLNFNVNHLIIDLECCINLEEISRTISHYSDKCHNIIFIGSKGIYVELFSCFHVLDVNLPVDMIITAITHHKGINPIQIKQFILSCRSLDILTKTQLKICLLDRENRISDAPEILNLTISSIYRNISSAMVMFNFKKLINFRYFIANEFNDLESSVCLAAIPSSKH